MVANMKVDKMDGFCVGEPWNARAIADNIGFTAITTQQMWPDHPEKVCAFTEEFATKNPKTVKASLKALHLSSVYIDKMENRPKAAEIISRPTYINCPPEIILGRLLGKYDYGDGRKEQDPNYMIFSERECNFPHPTFGIWWLSQFRRWGMVKGAPDYEGSQTSPAPGHLPGRDEGDGRDAEMAPTDEVDALRWRHVRSGEPGKVRALVSGQQSRGITEDDETHRTFPTSAVGIAFAGLAWWIASTLVTDLPSPLKTWEESKIYILEPWEKRGEMDQGIGLLAYYSLVRVAKGFSARHPDWHAAGFLLGVSSDDSPDVRSGDSGPAADLTARLAAAGPGSVPEIGAGGAVHHRPVLHVADGDQHHVGRAIDSAGLLERRESAAPFAMETFTKVLLPADASVHVHGISAEPGDCLAGDRRGEMLTGTPGVGGFLWQEYNSLIYAHILLCILTIGIVGFMLDRLMGWPKQAEGAVTMAFHRSSRLSKSFGSGDTCWIAFHLSVDEGEFVSIVGSSGRASPRC